VGHKRRVRQLDSCNYCPPVTTTITSDVEDVPSNQFRVRLASFEGPFDLLLHLISKQKLEVTVLALHEVTDEFIAHIKDQGQNWDLNEATEFLVIAATLLDLKAARLLPSGEVEDEEDLAVLEARDLLFARLLQYKAFKEVSAMFAATMEAESHRFYRNVALEEPYRSILPEVLISISPAQLAAIAISALAPAAPAPEVGLEHLHNPLVSVREQAIAIAATVKRRKITTFRTLVADAEHTMVIVARFLAVLELYRERLIAFEQSVALGELTIRWIGSDDLDVESIETEEFVDESESEEND
jgi:segregation and condensation protein A